MFRIQLKKLREEAGESQYSFAKKFGVAQSTIGNWESGTREPNLDSISRLADYFGVTVDHLLGREEKSARADGGEDMKSFFPEVFIKAYQALNDEGREKVIEYATDLAASGRYRKKADKHEMGSAAG